MSVLVQALDARACLSNRLYASLWFSWLVEPLRLEGTEKSVQRESVGRKRVGLCAKMSQGGLSWFLGGLGGS